MAPVIRHLRAHFSELPSLREDGADAWNFAAQIKHLGPDFYRKIILLHPILNMEYSLLCEQMRVNFSSINECSREELVEQLTAALMLAELLEHVHEHYLIVPREVVRLRAHQALYKKTLEELGGYTFPHTITERQQVTVGNSLSLHVREYTAFFNQFRLLTNRSKRFLNSLDAFGTGSETYKQAIANLDYYANPVLAYFAWCFFTPRLITNLFLLAKHTIPGSWMAEQEQSLGWQLRLQAQLQRRWFELGNDVLWVIISLLNCFICIDTLAYAAPYLSMFAFIYDVGLVVVRAYIELERLHHLQSEYTLQWQQEDEEGKKSVEQYQHYLNARYHFELMRLSLSVIATTGVLIAMSMTVPLITNPLIPLIASCLLLVIWVINFTLVQILEHNRPNDNVEIPSNLTRFSLFAPKNQPSARSIETDSEPSLSPKAGT